LNGFRGRGSRRTGLALQEMKDGLILTEENNLHELEARSIFQAPLLIPFCNISTDDLPGKEYVKKEHMSHMTTDVINLNRLLPAE